MTSKLWLLTLFAFAATASADPRILHAAVVDFYPLTSLQRDMFLAIEGDVINNSTTGTFQRYHSGSWQDFGTQGPVGPTGATGSAGATGATGATGAAGSNGQGVPTGGTTNQVLAKSSATNYATAWVSGPTSCALESASCLLTTTCSLTCSASKKVTGGGCNASIAVAVQANYPSSATTWRCNFALTATVTVWAICCNQ